MLRKTQKDHCHKKAVDVEVFKAIKSDSETYTVLIYMVRCCILTENNHHFLGRDNVAWSPDRELPNFVQMYTSQLQR